MQHSGPFCGGGLLFAIYQVALIGFVSGYYNSTGFALGDCLGLWVVFVVVVDLGQGFGIGVGKGAGLRAVIPENAAVCIYVAFLLLSIISVLSGIPLFDILNGRFYGIRYNRHPLLLWGKLSRRPHGADTRTVDTVPCSYKTLPYGRNGRIGSTESVEDRHSMAPRGISSR